MNRFKKAWLALTGRVPAADVLPEASLGKAYCVTDWSYLGGMVFWPDARRYYGTCTQAYADEPGRQVEEVQLLKVGDATYCLPDNTRLRAIKLQPKPKREKGKRAK